MTASLQYGNPLQRRLKNFHVNVDEAIFNTEWSAEVAVMVFSDSLFVATTDPKNCMDFCQRLICECLASEIPLRMGVGFGTFISNSLSFEAVPQAKVVNTQFLGTGVVFANDAEKAVKGMRIALHPSAVEALNAAALHPDRRLALPKEQVSEHASHEWNYLPSSSAGSAGLRKQREELAEHVEKMRATSAGEPTIQIHYDRTLSAMSQMLYQMHQEWLKPGRGSSR